MVVCDPQTQGAVKEIQGGGGVLRGQDPPPHTFFFFFWGGGGEGHPNFIMREKMLCACVCMNTLRFST